MSQERESWVSPRLEYVERVPRIAFGKGVMKFAFVRREPVADRGEDDPIVMVGMFVMSDDNFAETAIFFQSALNDLVQKGRVSRDRVEELRKIFDEGDNEKD